MNLGWRGLLPLSLLNLLATGVFLSMADLPPSDYNWIVLGAGGIAVLLVAWAYRRQQPA
jgi:hypothetical protein